MSLAARRWLIAILGVVVMAAYMVASPPKPLLFDFGLLSWPVFHKVGAASLALIELAAIDLAAWSLGGAITRPMRLVPDPLFLLPLRIGLGLAALGTAVLALAAAGLLVTPALGALVVVSAAAAVPGLVRAARAARGATGPPRRWWIAASLLLVPAVLDAFVPRFAWDALTYHVAVPQQWLEAGRLVVTPFSAYTTFPHLGESLYALALGVGGAPLVKLVSLQFGVLVLAALYAVGRRVSPRAGIFAAVVLFSDPLFQWELGSAYVDLPLCLFTTLAVALLADWITVPTIGSLVAAGVCAGACCALRYPGAVVPLALAAVVVATARQRPLRATTLAVVTLGVAAVAILSPWLARNLAATGNPFAPALQPWFGAYFDQVVVDQWMTMAHRVGMGRDLGDLLLLPWNLAMRSRDGIYSNSFGFQAGALPLVLLPAALLVTDVRRAPYVRVALGVTGLLTLVWFFTAQEARYLLPAFPLVALAGGAAIDKLADAARGSARIAAALVGAAAVFALLLGMWPAWNEFAHRYDIALGRGDARAFEVLDPAAWVGRALREQPVAGRRVLLLFESRDWYFRGVDRIPYHVNEGSPVLQLVHRAADPQALRCRLAALGVTDVVVNLDAARRYPPEFVPGYGPAEFSADMDKLRAFLDQWAEPILTRGPVIAARLKPAGECTSR